MRIIALSLMCAAATIGAQTPPVRPVKLVVNIGEKPGSNQGLFAGIASVVLAKDKLYVLEGRPCTVRVFEASTGKAIRQFGSPGDGAGQCMRPGLLTVTDSTVVITEFTGPKPRLVVFTLEGKTVKGDPAPPTPQQPMNRTLRGGGRFIYARTPVNTSSASTPLGDNPPPQSLVIFQAPGSAPPDTMFRVRLDISYVTRPDQSTPLSTFFGQSGTWAVSGDSLIVLVDGYEGVAKWYAISEKGPELKRTENLGKKGAPITPEEVAARGEQMTRMFATPGVRVGMPPTPLPPGSVKIFHAPERWSIATTAFFAPDGALWISDRGVRPVTDPNMRLGETSQYEVYPPTGAPYTIELPATFVLTTVLGNRIYGYAQVGTGTVPIYEISPP